MSEYSLINVIRDAVDRSIRESAEYIGGTNDDGSFFVDGDVDPKQVAVEVARALKLQHSSSGGAIWGEQNFRWQTPWMSGAPSFEDLAALRDF